MVKFMDTKKFESAITDMKIACAAAYNLYMESENLASRIPDIETNKKIQEVLEIFLISLKKRKDYDLFIENNSLTMDGGCESCQ